MPWPIQAHGVDIVMDEYDGMDVYVVELLLSLSTDEKRVLKPSTYHITTNVGTTLLLENDCVKVWQFLIPPKRKSHMHRHVHNYVFINLVKSKTRGLDEKWRYATPEVVQEAGQVTYVSLDHEAIHAAENVGEDTFWQVIVEFKEQTLREWRDKG